MAVLKPWHRLAGCVVFLFLAAGCQTAHPIVTHRLIEHQAVADFSGLQSAEPIDKLAVIGAPPRNWRPLKTQSTALYTHEQWRSPSLTTGVGIAYIHLPIPLGTRAVVWLAKHEYLQHGDAGRLIAEWTDSLGRAWFEGENDKYHVRGYVLSQGFDAWIVYFGYKTAYTPNPAELAVAARSADTVVPLTPEQRKASATREPKVADADK